jgi:predicted hydrocarbon binding protein
VLVASLHQAISDILPARLGFYESWLHAEGLRDGTIGLAPLYAVLSFLRQEGAAYDEVMTRAGEYAAEWSIADIGGVERRAIESAPNWLRLRLIMRLARQLVRSSYRSSRMSARVRRGAAEIDVRGSIFCSVREPVSQPLCRYYAAAFARMLALFEVPARIEVRSCRSTAGGGPHCVLDLVPSAAEGQTEVSAA